MQPLLILQPLGSFCLFATELHRTLYLAGQLPFELLQSCVIFVQHVVVALIGHVDSLAGPIFFYAVKSNFLQFLEPSLVELSQRKLIFYLAVRQPR